jgi:hypothetical protein
MKLSEHPTLTPHLGKPVILDSNLLLFYWCSSFNPNLITTFKRLNTFQAEDVELLAETLKIFSVVRTTPHVLTEVSNLAKLNGTYKDAWCEFFAKQIGMIAEIYTPSLDIALDLAALRFGLTDAALTSLAKTHVIMTIDFPLSNSLESRRLNVINFTHLRSRRLES